MGLFSLDSFMVRRKHPRDIVDEELTPGPSMIATAGHITTIVERVKRHKQKPVRSVTASDKP